MTTKTKTTMGNKTTFKTLAALNVKDRLEKKGRFDYLSWAYAWAMVKDQYPDANRKVYESEATELNFFTDGKTGYVKVGVTIEGVEHIDYLPVMDFRNKSISADLVNSMDINKTIQRATAKAIAMHGLGLALYTGEDLPEEVVTPVPKKLLKLDLDDENCSNVLNYIVANKDKGLDHIISQLERKYKVKATLKKEISKIISE